MFDNKWCHQFPKCNANRHYDFWTPFKYAAVVVVTKTKIPVFLKGAYKVFIIKCKTATKLTSQWRFAWKFDYGCQPLRRVGVYWLWVFRISPEIDTFYLSHSFYLLISMRYFLFVNLSVRILIIQLWFFLRVIFISRVKFMRVKKSYEMLDTMLKCTYIFIIGDVMVDRSNIVC